MRPVTIIAVSLLLGAALVLFVHFGATGEEFSRYNVGWNGASAFFATLDRHTTEEIARPADLAGYRGVTLLVIAPDRTMTAEDGAMYRDFVARGNTLFLADDFGTGNDLLRAMGSGISIRRENISSLDRAYNDPSMIIVSPVNTTRFLPEGSNLVLNHAASLKGGTPVVATTLFSWVDNDSDSRLSAKETLGAFTVMAQETMGGGTVFVLSDPSIFINGMEDAGYGNAAFRTAVAGSGPIVIDGYSSRLAREDPAGELIHAVRSNTAYMFAIAALLVAGILIARQRRVV